MFYFEELGAFYRSNIKFLVVGGLAVNLYGVPRVTQDIDIILFMEKENVLAFCQVMKELGYMPRLPVNPEDMADSEKLREWTEERNMKAFSFYHKEKNYKVVDIVLIHPLDFKQAEKRKKVFAVEDIEIPVVSIEDLIKMKKASGRKSDISDAKMLIEAKRIGGWKNR